MPPFPGREDYRQLLAVTSTRNGVPPEPQPAQDPPPPVEEPQASEPAPQQEPEPEAPPPPAAKRRR